MHWWSAATSHSRDTLACWPLQTHTPVKQHHRTLMCAGVELVAHALLAIIDVVRGWSSNNPGSRSQWTSVSYNIALPALLGAEAAHIAGTLHTPLLSSWLHIAVLHLPSRLLNPTATTARQRMSGRACRTGACTQKILDTASSFVLLVWPFEALERQTNVGGLHNNMVGKCYLSRV